jgi:protein phosphatase
MLTEAEAEKHPLRNVITRALGGALQVTPDASEIEAQSGDVVLLCSDGLTGMVPESEILRIVTANNGDLEKACQQLIDAANERGGLDNVTAVLVKAI